MSSNTQPARGTRDFLPDEVRRREYVMRVVREVYERHGFEPLETPAFENIETLLGRYGDEGNKLIFKILMRGEHESSGQADLALRYDLTVPLARVAAQYQNDLPKFFKRYQIQPVWRAERPAKGRYREFYQCDIDSIGSPSPVIEADQLGAVCEILVKLGFEGFKVRVNHRRVLAGLLNSAGLAEPLHGDALIALDKLDKIGPEGVEQEFVARGIDAGVAAQCLRLFRRDPEEAPADSLAALRATLGADDPAVANLEDIVRLSDETAAKGRIRIDLSLARGLSYYTGAIMEITVPDLPGSLGGGGRYDNLIGMFLGRDIPACGFSLGLERIVVVMTERQMFPAKVARGPVDVMVTFLSDALRSDALKLATELRAEQLRVDVYPEASRKFDKPLKYASSRGVPVMAILGEDESARQEVAVRDLQTRQQENVPRLSAAKNIAGRVRLA